MFLCFRLPSVFALVLKPSNPGCIIDKRVLTEDLIDVLRLTALINGNNDHYRRKGDGERERETEKMLSASMFSFVDSGLGFVK